MSFVKRAERAHARGDETRAIMVLIEGLKREPGRADAIELLVLWFSVESPKIGLEHYLIKMLQVQPGSHDVYSSILDNLRANSREDIADALLGPAQRAGLRYIPIAAPEESVASEAAHEESPEAESAKESVDASSTVEGIFVVETQAEPEGEIDAAEEEVAEGPEAAQAEQANRVEEDPPKSRKRRWTKRHSSISLFLTMFLIVAGWYWVEGREVAEIHSLDTLIGTLDPLNFDQDIARATEAARDHKGSSEVQERYTFLQTLKEGRAQDIGNQDFVSEWGYASAVLNAISAQDLEQAIRFTKVLEMKYPDSLASVWMKATLAEHRGDETTQEDAFRTLTRRFPEFLDGWLGLVRLAIRRGDSESVVLAHERIKQLVPDHPYLVLQYQHQRYETLLMGAELDKAGRLVLREVAGSMRADTKLSESSESFATRFYKAFMHLQAGLSAAEVRDRAQARAEVDRALELEPELGPALVMRGALMIRAFETQGVRDLRLLKFIGGVEPKLLDLGWGFGAIGAIAVGHPQLSPDLLKTEAAGPWLGLAATHFAYEKGGEKLDEQANFFQPAESVRGALQVSESQAEGLLTPKVGILPDLILEGPRLWFSAYRNEPGLSESVVKIIEKLDESSSFLRLWLVDALLWLGEKGVSKHLGAIDEGQGRHFHWVSAIVSRASGEYREADIHFSNAGAENSESLASYAMRLERLGAWDESRKMYHKSLLLNRANMAAIQGLGRTYVKLGGETSSRDLERIAQGYAGAEFVAQKAESLKWLGIVLGVRAGDESALDHINAAIETVGPRADLMVEVGHYWFARKDLNQARVSFSQALQADSTNADAHFGLGRVAWETRDFQIAEDHLKRYIELQPRGEHRKWVEERLARPR